MAYTHWHSIGESAEIVEREREQTLFSKHRLDGVEKCKFTIQINEKKEGEHVKGTEWFCHCTFLHIQFRHKTDGITKMSRNRQSTKREEMIDVNRKQIQNEMIWRGHSHFVEKHDGDTNYIGNQMDNFNDVIEREHQTEPIMVADKFHQPYQWTSCSPVLAGSPVETGIEN